MKLPAQTPIKSTLVIGLSDEGDVEWLRGARNIRDAQGLQKEVPAAIPTVLIVQVVNNATSEGGRRLPATPTRVHRSDALRKGAGVLVVADAANHLCQVRPYKTVKVATRLVGQVDAQYPRVVVGKVHSRYFAG